MSDLIWLSRAQMRRIVSGFIFVIRNVRRWRDAPAQYGPHKPVSREVERTVHNRFIRWSRLGVFNRIFEALAAKGGKTDQLMIDATHLKAHRTATSLLKKGDAPRRIGRTKGGLNSKLHAVCDAWGRPRVMLLLPALPSIKALLGDRGYDADWLRQALAERGIAVCIPSKTNRKVQIPHDKVLYRRRHRIETMFGRLKD